MSNAPDRPVNLDLKDAAGLPLGSRVVTYDERDCILYALAVGAGVDELELVYERDLKVLPTFALALGTWICEAAGKVGIYDPVPSLHATQELHVHRPLPKSGRLEMKGHIQQVYDKGRHAAVELALESEYFTAVYGIHVPDAGGWGGDPVPRTSRHEFRHGLRSEITTLPTQAALYRLTGDLHPVHIDPEVARGTGLDRPILHGLCTLGVAVRQVASVLGMDPWSLQDVSARLSRPVLPGDVLITEVDPGAEDRPAVFTSRTVSGDVLRGGTARFA